MSNKDQHWADVPIVDGSIRAPALVCLGISTPLAVVGSYLGISDPDGNLVPILCIGLVSLPLFVASMILMAKQSHAMGSRTPDRERIGRCVVSVAGRLHGPFPDEDAARAWANRESPDLVHEVIALADVPVENGMTDVAAAA